MRDNLALDFGDASKRLIPAHLEFAGDQPVGRVSGVILPEGAISGVARGFKIAAKSLARLIPSISSLFGCSHRRGDGAGSDNAEERSLDRIVDAQAPEGDATRFAVIQPSARATVTRDMMLGATIAQRQFASAAAATDQTGEQGVAMFGRAVMLARWNVARDHCADRFEPLPAHIAIVGPGLQREPVGARLAADPHTGALGAVSRRHGCSTIGIGAAVDRVLDHPVESGVTRTPPARLAVRMLHRKIEVLLMEPEQRLSRASKLLDLVEDQRDRRLHAPVWILLVAVAGLYEADRRRHDEFAAPGLRVTGGKRALTQKIKLILVETSLEPQQQSVIAVPRRVDRRLIDEDCVDDPAHLDQLLPIPAIAGEARDLAGADRADLAEADLGHHPLESGALHAAGR